MKWASSVILIGISISDTGLIKNHKTNKLLKPYQNKRNGYMYISFSINGKIYSKRVHRLVAIAFIENPNKYSDVNHKDGDKTNNKKNNLEWCTRSKNILHSYDTGIRKRKHERSKKREIKSRNRSKKSVYQYDMNGVFIKKYSSGYEASNENGVSSANISSVCLGKRKAAGDFIWKFTR
jgi:HNH endonuclease